MVILRVDRAWGWGNVISLRMDCACLRGKVLGHCQKGMEMVGAKSLVMAIKLVDSCTFFSENKSSDMLGHLFQKQNSYLQKLLAR